MSKQAEKVTERAMERWRHPFRGLFTRPSWLNAVALATGVVLNLNRRTVCAALWAADGSLDGGFCRFRRTDLGIAVPDTALPLGAGGWILRS
jgi:hypothetical protein